MYPLRERLSQAWIVGQINFPTYSANLAVCEISFRRSGSRCSQATYLILRSSRRCKLGLWIGRVLHAVNEANGHT